MPDIADDRAEGILGLPQRVGARASGIITYLVLAIGATIAFVGPGLAASANGGFLAVQWIGLGLNATIAAIGIVLVCRLSPARPPRRIIFQLIMVAALINVGMIAVAGTKILA
jgi:4-hydroxybenzoate polyprenyltransferase